MTDCSGAHSVTAMARDVKSPPGMTADSRWAAVQATARAQAGVVTRQQVLDAGFAAKEWMQLVRDGRLLAVHRGVYELFSPRDWYQREHHVALLLSGDGSALSHRSAAAVHRLWGRGDQAATPLEVIVQRKRRVAPPGVEIHRSDLAEGDVEVVQQLRVTTVVRTLIDLASVCEPEALAMAFESARKDATFLKALAARLDAATAEGAEKLRELIADAQRRPRRFDSAWEVMFWRRLKFSGLELPVPQFKIEAPRQTYFIDFAWPRQKVAVELEGFYTHGKEQAFPYDKRRAAALAAVGYLYFPLTMERYKSDLAGFFKELGDGLQQRRAKAA